jgi:hypothetical protein
MYETDDVDFCTFSDIVLTDVCFRTVESWYNVLAIDDLCMIRYRNACWFRVIALSGNLLVGNT